MTGTTDGRGSTAFQVHPAGWTHAFAEKSARAFGEVFADDIVLEATVLRTPIDGRCHVMRVMGAACDVYESLVFTHEASVGDRCYLEWEGTALGGLELSGVTVLTKDESGRIVHAAIHHRPLGAALRFSGELRDRLAGVIDRTCFYDPYERVPNGWD